MEAKHCLCLMLIIQETLTRQGIIPRKKKNPWQVFARQPCTISTIRKDPEDVFLRLWTMLKVHFKKQKKNNKLSAAHKCKGNKIALTNFTKPFNCSSRLKDKLISVYNLCLWFWGFDTVVCTQMFALVQLYFHYWTMNFVLCVMQQMPHLNHRVDRAKMLSACPRHKHYGTKVVHYAAASAVCHIHKGAECRKDIMDKLSIPGGTHTSHAFRLKDNKHL